MNTQRRLSIAFAVALLWLGAAFAQVNDYREIKAPPLRQVTVPPPKRIVLGNGMVVFLMEDHELPLVRGTALIRGGGRDLPAGKAGMAGIYGGSWRTGGTKTKTGAEPDEVLEARGPRGEAGAGGESA